MEDEYALSDRPWNHPLSAVLTSWSPPHARTRAGTHTRAAAGILASMASRYVFMPYQYSMTSQPMQQTTSIRRTRSSAGWRLTSPRPGL